MERDFLGIGGGRDLVMREEAGYLGRSAVQWPFSSLTPSKQQFMSFQGAQEERSKTLMFDQVSSSGFQPVTADALTSAHRFPSMKHLGADGEGVHQFLIPGFPFRGSEHFNGSAANHPSEIITFPAVSHDSFPIGTPCPLFRASCPASGTTTAITSLKQQHPLGGGPSVASSGAGPLTASVAPRDMIQPPGGGSAQLTIFYGGMVNVYDDVPLEKGLAIMFLAGNASGVNSSVGNVPVQAPVAAPTKLPAIETKNMNHNQTHLTPALSPLSSPISAASHSGAQSGSGSNSIVDVTGAKTTISLAPTSQQEPPKSTVTTTAVGSASSATLVPRAVPQARKASLARFLEKRKERVSNVAPYPSPQKMPDYTSAVDGKSVTGEALHSSSLENQSWCLSTHKKNTCDSSSSLSTKLEM